MTWLLDVHPLRVMAQWRWGACYAVLDVANASMLEAESIAQQGDVLDSWYLAIDSNLAALSACCGERGVTC